MFQGILKGLAALLAFAAVQAGAPARAESVVFTPQMNATLTAYAPEGVAPGKPVWLGVKFVHIPGWHTYWKNPGDAGLVSTFDWTLPKGATSGEVDYPLPETLKEPPLTVYGYEGEVLLPTPVTIGADYAGGPLNVGLHATWLICDKTCIPEEGDFTLTVPQAGMTEERAAFEQAFAARPTMLASAKGSAAYQGDTLVVRVEGLPPSARGAEIGFIPEKQFVIDHAKPFAQKWDGDAWMATLPAASMKADFEGVLPAVLTLSAGGPKAIRVQLSADGAPVPGVAPTPAPAVAAPFDVADFFVKLGAAFLGGVLLNLMPCVFPVLSLKALSMTRHAGERRELAASGLAYTGGVLLSFLALAGALLALRGLGEQLGWGFQLQSPGFVAAMAVLFFLIGLNLAGVFDVGSVLPSSVAAARAKNPTVDSFLTGVLAVAVASPCTAPFMAGSIGLALTLPAAASLSLFAAVGLGLAAPLLIVSLAPGFASILPKPGKWMDLFKQFMAFPMFAAVVWLIWVLSVGAGPNAVLGVLALMVTIAFAIWIWRVTPSKPWRAAALVLIALAVFTARPLFNAPAAGTTASASTGAWGEPWAAEKIDALAAAGKPAFVDFTAAWCVTCQVNKAVLHDQDVVAKLDQCGVTRFEADWTTQDAKIGAALAGMGRSGVPVYALYKGEAAGEKPLLLNEILLKDQVLAEIAKLPSCASNSTNVKGGSVG